MSKAQRDKGARFERAVAKAFREAMPGLTVERGWQAHSGTAQASDVEAGPFAVECKVGKAPPYRAAYEQACEGARPGQWPIAVVKQDRGEAVAVMALNDLLEVLGQWWRATR